MSDGPPSLPLDAALLRASSLAQRFAEDFGCSAPLPLAQLDERARAALHAFVRPLLALAPRAGGQLAQDGVLAALERLRGDFSAPDGLGHYLAARHAADWLQARLPACLLDAAAATCCTSCVQSAWSNALAQRDPVAFRELLVEDLRRRLVANGLGHASEPVAVRLDDAAQAVAASPRPNDGDLLQLPASACYAFAGAPGSLLKRAAWKRQLARTSSHYLAPLLGPDGPGSVLLTGTALAGVVKGLAPVPAATSDTAPAGPGAAVSSSGGSGSEPAAAEVHHLAFAGYPAPAQAQAALDGCMTEALTRWHARHPAPLVSAASGAPLLPLAVASEHHLLLLLPEPVGALLPAPVRLEPQVLAAAAEAGAWEGPAAAAAAGAGAAQAGHQARPAQAASGYREVALAFDLALHPSVEALLLAAPSPLAAFAWDGRELWALPSAMRALASGVALLEPAAAARRAGAPWGAAEPAGAREAAPGPCAAPAPGGALAPEQAAAAAAAASAAVAAGWRLEQLTGWLDKAVGASAESSTGAAASPEEASSRDSPLALLASPGRLRGLLLAAAPAETAGCGEAAAPRERCLQQLRGAGWVWGACEAREGAGQQDLPEAVAAALPQRWWPGPVLRGASLLGRDVLEQESCLAAGRCFYPGRSGHGEVQA